VRRCCAGTEETDNTMSLDTGRKDSLSLNVEFVKVNISRSRKGFVASDVFGSAAGTSFSSSGGVASSKLTGVDSQTAANIVRFSGNIIRFLTLDFVFQFDTQPV